jgi:hypothetical protein
MFNLYKYQRPLRYYGTLNNLANIILRIYSQIIHLLKHRSRIVSIPPTQLSLAGVRRKKEHIDEFLIDTSPTGIYLNINSIKI